ncbi:NUDIX hydrolase [Acuticoccus yangtzensis]|uniref:NUDIX hydrolase n=1 Tax=Acuticoccus yangtzensis TaxID=1443441 RepID=UPI000949A4FE|nr:CoA pyrophosphatase [Acuticoccus yangtzensis]
MTAGRQTGAAARPENDAPGDPAKDGTIPRDATAGGGPTAGDETARAMATALNRAKRRPAARNGEGALTIAPFDTADPAGVTLLERARGLRPARDYLAADAPLFGDHILNPEWHRGPATPARDAAVLIALGRMPGGEIGVVLTERASHLNAHAGQIAFPGGKIEPGETPAMAALREADEEVAMPPGAVELLGLTEAYLTRTGFRVVPVLARLTAPVTLTPDPGEVATIFLAPWARLMDTAHREEREVMLEGRPRRFYETMVGERRVWGVTAGIFKLVSERLYGP